MKYTRMAAVDLDAEQIAKLSKHLNERHLAIQAGQAEHRIELVKFWGISKGEKVLEVGCGQGDATTVLASAVGETGHVTAVDPGELTYGMSLVAMTFASYIFTLDYRR